MPMGSAFPRSFVPLLAAGLVAVAPSLGQIAGMLGDSDALAGQAADVRVGGMPLGPQRVIAVRSQHVGHVGLGLAARCGVLGIDLRAETPDCASGETAPH